MLEPESGAEPARAIIPPWGEGEPDAVTLAAIADSPYARAYELARRLVASSATPYDYVRAVENHLADGYTYSEEPRASNAPLADFLFEERAGYCQQFSGAMALLLRFGGVPARVAAGFSPGAFDSKRREYVVRDIDAHSWVEVYFPSIGWVTRDPTPSAAPARAQVSDTRATEDGSIGPRPDAGVPARPRFEPETPADAAGGAFAAEEASGGFPVVPVVALALALLAIGALAVRRRRSRRRSAGSEPSSEQLAELRRALARSGRPVDPQTTLAALAARWHGTPAEGYVRVLESARYGYGSGRPTRAQRAALRRELGLGLGVRGRLRAWWALPPRVRARTRPRAPATSAGRSK